MTGRRKASSHASTTSQLSILATKERDEDVLRVMRRKEEDQREAEIKMLELMWQMEKVRKGAEMRGRMNDRNIEALQRSHEENQRMIEEKEEETQHLEYTVTGIGVLPTDDMEDARGG